ncbi:ATP-binding protein [Lysobacter niastensis]|uniref:ATP-binding protein n=1 Tax=Lysobacter niastensis TaxID=380629 RepID=A0ABS0BCB4_9GAMM|nr:ATP-binding protein [Lysobacter niastensis]MBF6025339.1 ATP-binding protein [Lysobacter niastensis]
MQLRIEVPHQREHLGELLTAIDRALAEHRVAPEVRDDMQLIAEEVVCNAMDHGVEEASRDGQKQIVVDIARHGNRLHVEFRDTGKPFDPLSQPMPDLEACILDRPIGGLGVHLIREIAEAVSYERDEPYNVLRVVLRAA